MPLGSQPSFRQHIRLIGRPRRRRRVSDEYPRRAFALHALSQQRQHFLRAFRIEIPGRFVGEHQARPVHQGARDRDALRLSTRELVRHAFASLAELHRLEQRGDAPAHGLVPHAVQCERERDVLRHRQVRQDVKRLEYEPHVLAADKGESVVVERAQGHAIEEHLPGIGPLEPGDEVEQRGFPDPRFAHHRDVVSRGELEADVQQHGLRAGAGKGLAEVSDRQHAGEITCARASRQARRA